jgi:hypothetical protein
MTIPTDIKDLEQRKFADINSLPTVRVTDAIANSLVPSDYDYIALSYTGDNLTGVVYKKGGASGTVVSTLTLGYSGSNLTSVTKS